MTSKGITHLRELFAQEAEQRLARLGQLLLELEQQPTAGAADLIAEIFREVHTLKGSAAVVGFDDVSTYAHQVEDRLGALRSGTVPISAPIVDALLAAADGLGAMINDQLNGEAPSVDHHAVLAQLAAAFDGDPAHIELEPTVEALLSPLAPVPDRQRASSAGRDHAGTVMVPVERLDELVRMVGVAAAAHLRVGSMLEARIGGEAASLSEYSDLSRVLNGLQERAMQTRMVPVATVTDQLHRAVRDSARSLGKDVRWEARGEDTELDRGVLAQLSDALLHLVRNAVDHGIETPTARVAAGKPATAVVRLHAMQLGSEVIIAVSDDGAGIDLDHVRQKAASLGFDVGDLSDDDAMQLIFRSGFSTAKFVSDISGRGVGLDVVRNSVEAARGRVEVRSTAGAGSEFRIVVPITLAVLRSLLVEASGQRFALPLHRVAQAQAEDDTEMLHAEGRRMVLVDGRPVPVSDLADTLGLPATRTVPGTLVVVNGTTGRHAFLVDALLGQRDVVVKGLSALVPRLDVIAGASVEPDGSILLVLDPPGLVDRSARATSRSVVDVSPGPVAVHRHGRLLVVDDALTVRELQRTILERAGFEVEVAADGVEALERLEDDVFDLVLTDVEMPRMDGFALTERIRAHPIHGQVAVLILTSLASDTDRRRGMDAGADGYIVKSAFDEQALLAAVDRLVGMPV